MYLVLQLAITTTESILLVGKLRLRDLYYLLEVTGGVRIQIQVWLTPKPYYTRTWKQFPIILSQPVSSHHFLSELWDPCEKIKDQYGKKYLLGL